MSQLHVPPGNVGPLARVLSETVGVDSLVVFEHRVPGDGKIVFDLGMAGLVEVGPPRVVAAGFNPHAAEFCTSVRQRCSARAIDSVFDPDLPCVV